MTKQALIQKTIDVLEKLPQERVSEVADYADCVFKKYEDEILRKGIATLVSESKSFEFLKHEEDLYTLDDLKERYR